MKQTYFYLGLLLCVLFSCTDDREITTAAIIKDPNSVLVHYWNFNTLAGTVTEIAPDFSLVPSGTTITYPGSGDGYMDDFDPGYATNSRNGDVEGFGFRARNPSNTRNLLFAMPTTGYRKIIVQFATARTGSGATSQIYSYSTDGTNFTTEGLAVSTHSPIEDPQNSLVTLDFSAITSVNDNPDFKIRIEFGGDAAAGASGNNRFDNLTLEGIPLGDIVPPDTSLYLFQYWNFNALPAGTLTSIAPDATLIAANTAAITYQGTGAGYMDLVSPGSALNAQNGDTEGTGLRARNPSDDRSLYIKAPTTGYKNISVKFATAKSSAAGAPTQLYSYSLDGTNFLTANLPVESFSTDIEPVYDIVTLDFSAISGANNNPDFIVKIDFDGTAAAGTSGNNRFDNITFQGNQL
ncbi:MAG TPA: hypothetical protein VK528_08620 [Flavobacterium sp.]|nr:hypothetical protein [Flavobacterium sp.]